ncbi:MAG: HdeD family acid-resistance protein [Cetobacterium sp.]
MLQTFDFLDLGNSLKKMWKYYFILGIVFLVLGIFAIFKPAIFSLYIVSLLGWFFLFAGFGNIFYGFSGRNNPAFHWGTILFMGILEVLSGFIILLNPISSLYILTIYIGVFLIFRGCSLIFAKNYYGITAENVHLNGLRSLTVMNGILDLVFGVLAILIPIFAEAVFIYTIAFYVLLAGLLLMVYAFQIKQSLNHDPEQ